MSLNPPNGHDHTAPDLTKLEAREQWGKDHGLPPGFVIVTKSELLFIQERTQLAMSDNLKYRAAARLLLGATGLDDFIQKLGALRKSYDAVAVELRRLIATKGRS